MWVYIILSQIIHQWENLERGDPNFQTKDGFWCELQVRSHKHFIVPFIYTMRALMVVIEFVLFFILRHELKKHLDFYYKKTKKSLIILLFCSVLYFFLHFLYLTGFKYVNVSKEKILKTHTTGEYKGYEAVLWLVCDLIWNAPLYTLFYYNIKNIDFEKYLEDIMQCLNIGDHFQNASIFLRVKLINGDAPSVTESVSVVSQSGTNGQNSSQSFPSFEAKSLRNKLKEGSQNQKTA